MRSENYYNDEFLNVFEKFDYQRMHDFIVKYPGLNDTDYQNRINYYKTGELAEGMFYDPSNYLTNSIGEIDLSNWVTENLNSFIDEIKKTENIVYAHKARGQKEGS